MEALPYVAVAPPSSAPVVAARGEAVGWETLIAEQAPLAPVDVASPVPVEAVQGLAALIAPLPTLAPTGAPPPERNAARDAAPLPPTATSLPPTEIAPQGGGERYESLVKEVALYYGLDWHLLASMAYHESRFNPRALGRDNDSGLMQIIPDTWALVAPKVNVYDPFDPYSNLMAGGYFLTSMQQHFATLGYPEIHWALAAYNWGPTNLTRLLQRGGQWEDVPVEVQWYVWRILDDAAHPTAAWWQEELQGIAYP